MQKLRPHLSQRGMGSFVASKWSRGLLDKNRNPGELDYTGYKETLLLTWHKRLRSKPYQVSFVPLMIYQHLPNNKNDHKATVSKKMEQLKALKENTLVCGYREDDLVFLFMSKDPEMFSRLYNTLTKYHANSEHRYKSLHPPLCQQ